MAEGTGRKTIKHIAVDMLLVLLFTMIPVLMWSFNAHASDTGLPADYTPSDTDNRDPSMDNKYGIPWHQFKNIFTDDTVDGQIINVTCEPDDDWSDPEPVEGLRFMLYNSTTQETEAVLTTDPDGNIDLPLMKRGHTYILKADSSDYIIEGSSNIYLWALAAGDQGAATDGAYEHKTKYIRLSDDDPVPDNYLRLINQVNVNASEEFRDPSIYTMEMPVEYNGGPAPDGIEFIFTSAEAGSIETATKDGYVSAELVEDNDYTVHVTDERYSVDTFALTVKDKSEHKHESLGSISAEGRYCYDHTCCQRADKIVLVDKGEEKEGSISSLKKYTNSAGRNVSQAVVQGMDFKTLLLLVRYPEISLPEGSGVTDYDAAELTLANPHRWEKCIITEKELSVTQMLPQKRTVKNVYLLADGILRKIPFTQESKDQISFSLDSMSLYPVVVEYAETEPEADPVKPKPDTSKSEVVSKKTKTINKPKATAIRKLKPGKKAFAITWKKRTKNTTGYLIQYSIKKNFKKAKTVRIKSPKKTKLTVKKLKARKKYYVRIRTYRRISKKTYYSAWSKVRSVKTR